MSTVYGSAQKGRFSSRGAKTKRASASAWIQIAISLAFLLNLFLLYTMIMQLTHQQKAFEASKAANLGLLALFTVGAFVLTWLVMRVDAWKRTLCMLLIFAILYLTVAFSQLPTIKKYRDIWIKTAMSTMRHQGLATYYFPASLVDEIGKQKEEALAEQENRNSTDPAALYQFDPNADNWPEPEGTWTNNETAQEMTPEQKQFYSLFYELNVKSAEAYFADHPDVLENGYMHMLVNETSLDGDGTSIRTKLGEKVLAIDADNRVLILEVNCDGSRGVLAIGKLPERLHLFASSNIANTTGGTYGCGQTVGTIAKRNDGLLAMTGSGFIDEDDAGNVGVGNGGKLAGYAMCNGTSYKGAPSNWGDKRLELHENDWFYITNFYEQVSSDTTDAMEFQPAMVVNGEAVDIGYWTELNPRSCIGQSKRGEIMMLCVEGRGAGGSWGCSLSVCRDLLLQHDCLTAMNCDGGTTAIMWYRGEEITRCSNAATPEGRYLPNAWVYVGAE